MATHNPQTYAYGQHWTPATDTQDPQPLGSCGDPRGCPPVEPKPAKDKDSGKKKR